MSLSTQLGADYIVLDMNAAPATADVLLVPAVSPQLIATLRSMFPKARVIVTEIEDKELGVNYQGPVRRLLNAGADAYLPPSTVPHLARQLDYTLNHGHQLVGGVATPLEIAPAAEHQIPKTNDSAAPLAEKDQLARRAPDASATARPVA